MKSFGERFKAWRKSHGVSNYFIESVTGLSRANLSQIESGKYLPSDEVLEIIAGVDGLSVTVEQLRRWRMLEEYPELEAEFENTSSVNAGQPSQQFHNHPLPDGHYRFPCVGTVSAGTLSVPESYTDCPPYFEFSDLPIYSPDMFCLKIVGDSMAPKFENGGIILVMETTAFQQNGLYVIQTEADEMTFKVFEMTSRGAKLKPINPAYDTISIHDKSIIKAYRVIEYKKTFV